MKVKLFNKNIGNFDNVYFSSDLHLNHQKIIDFSRKFISVEEMNDYIITLINKRCKENDLLVLLGDTLMIDKDYNNFISKINCNIIMLYGNHCNPNRFKEIAGICTNRLIYHGYYCELIIDKQIICCNHYPMFHWNYQSDDSFMLHGHNHGDESSILKEIHQYKCMDVGIDSYYNMYGEYNLFTFDQIKNLLQNKLTINRH